MIRLDDISKMGMQITWRLLYNGMIKGLLIKNEIFDYAVRKIMEGDKREEVCELAWGNIERKEDICDLLYRLIETNCSDDIENRKLRVAIVSNELKVKDDNYIDGLIRLTDLWAELGYPVDSPHVVQGLNNNISPTEYYTKENYDNLYKKNEEWLNEEVEFLKNR